MKNPFSISFGKKPIQYIARYDQTNDVIETFSDSHPSSQVTMITGVRGAGKTVLMENIAEYFRKDPDWIVLELNSQRDLLQSFGAKLYEEEKMRPVFSKLKLNFSALGFGAALEMELPVSDIENAIQKMLDQVKKANKKVLLVVDEVVNNEHVRIFTNAYQMYLRQDYPVFLLMTGLYENLYDLQNEKSQTFLFRAPKLVLDPLNPEAICNKYREVFEISQKEAQKMADLTKGYPFAFQVLGYIRWNERDGELEGILPYYDQLLGEYVYEKIWSELSPKDKKVLCAMADTPVTAVKDLREKIGMKPEEFSVYRERLKRKGIIETSQYGKVSFFLPRFEVFIKKQEDIYEA